MDSPAIDAAEFVNAAGLPEQLAFKAEFDAISELIRIVQFDTPALIVIPARVTVEMLGNDAVPLQPALKLAEAPTLRFSAAGNWSVNPIPA